MRLIFFYTALGQASPGPDIPWNPSRKSANRFAVGFQEEDYYWLIKRMLETGVIDECFVFVESTHDAGFLSYPGPRPFTCFVLPQIAQAERFIKPGDVIWVRGGFRTWHNYLVDLVKRGHWLMLYAANSGRERWPFWHVILDDRAGLDFVDGRDRVHLDFRKPTHPELFFPMNLELQYDVCIGASYIHDKKGQWRAINAISFLQERLGREIRCVMPGAERRGVMTARMFSVIRGAKLDVLMPGMVSRQVLNRIYNASKVFVHLGQGGQGDRGPIEALRCGCPLVIGYPQYHAPWTVADNSFCEIPPDPENSRAVAGILASIVANSCSRSDVHAYHETQAGVENVMLPRMSRLFELFAAHPVADRDYLRKELSL
jgi:hypothetical protein